MASSEIGFGRFAWRVTASHMVAYFVAGILALAFMGYEERFAGGALASIMRGVGSPIVALGPVLQAIVGLALSIILYPFRAAFLDSRNGWAKFALLIGGFTLFAPQVPGPGSFEGLLYTKLSIGEHLVGLPETVAYTALFSLGAFFWNRKPGKAWNVIAIAALCLMAIFSGLGLAASLGALPGA